MKNNILFKIITFLSVFVLISGFFVVPAHALIFSELLEEYKATKEFGDWTLYDWADFMHDGSYGLILSEQTLDNLHEQFGSYYDSKVAEVNNVPTSDVNNTMRMEFFDNNVTINNDERIEIGKDLVDVYKQCQDLAISSSGFYYCYSYKLQDSLGNFENVNIYNGIRDFLFVHSGEYDCIFLSFEQSSPCIYCFDTDNVGFVRHTNDVPNNRMFANIRSFSNYLALYLDSTNADRFLYNNGSFLKDSRAWTKQNVDIRVAFSTIESENEITNFTDNWVISENDYITYRVYDTLQDMQGSNPYVNSYYINTSVFNDFNNSTNGYTITENNSNNIDYGDITEYINNYFDDNGSYPDTNNVQIFIDNNIPPTSDPTPTPTPTPGPDDPGGGGSGSGGSGDSGSSVGIFDFLSKIGEVLGSLIKNLGNVLADLVEGIGSIISSLIESIPTVFSDFLGALIGWLPPELQALISLSITAMVIIGLIKLFKG